MTRGDALAGAAAAAALVLLGAPVGLVWAALVPRAQWVVGADGATLLRPETEVFVAADGYFLLVGALAGVLTGVAAYLLARRWAPGVVLGLAGGGVAASVVAAVAGGRLGRAGFLRAVDRAPTGTRLAQFASVRADAVLLAWPVVAVAVLAALVAAGSAFQAGPGRPAPPLAPPAPR